jgi:hypothetical protein
MRQTNNGISKLITLVVGAMLFCTMVVAPFQAGTFKPNLNPLAPAPALQTTTQVYVSDLPLCYAPNGWGPVEKDRSNGEAASNDGNTITLNGVTYSKGLGAHANSEVRFYLGGEYTTFFSKIGVDDEVGNNGSVTFLVYADNILLYNSGVMYGFSATKTINVSVAGRNELKLIVNYAGDNGDNDHADWAGAYLVRATPQQQIKYFGYVGPGDPNEMNQVSSFANFSYIGGDDAVPINDQLITLHNNGMRAIIDLGRVLWCADRDESDFNAKWFLCPDYQARWQQWTSQNPLVLNSNYVLAYSIMTESTMRAVNGNVAAMVADMNAAACYVKSTSTIPTMMLDNSADVVNLVNRGETYVVPDKVDWVGVTSYYIHPTWDNEFQTSVNILRANKKYWQRTVYVLDGFYKEGFHPHAPTSADMETIAKEWYTAAKQDPDSILLGVFIWDELTGECGRGSRSLPKNVRDTHYAIGRAILGRVSPTYGPVSNNSVIFTTQQPTSVVSGGGATWEEATQFSSSVNGRVTAIRFYRAEGESGTHVGRIWTDTGILLAQVTFLETFCAGWQEQVLPNPVQITAGVRYRVSYNINSNLGKTFAGLNTPITNGPLTAHTGFYSTPAGTFPNTNSGSNFFADVLFSTP